MANRLALASTRAGTGTDLRPRFGLVPRAVLRPLPPMDPTVVADRLYSLTYRPQELALYGDSQADSGGEQLTFNLRSAPLFDDPEERTTRHFRLLVLEVTAKTSEGQTLQLLKAGWELELATDAPCQVGTLPERMADIRLLLERIAQTTADLAKRAGVEPPFTGELITTLLDRYRTSA